MWAASPSQDAPSYWGKAVFWCGGGIEEKTFAGVFSSMPSGCTNHFPHSHQVLDLHRVFYLSQVLQFSTNPIGLNVLLVYRGRL